MAPLYKVTIKATICEKYYVRAETEDFARGIAIEHVLDVTPGYIALYWDDVEEVEEDDIDEDEVLS